MLNKHDYYSRLKAMCKEAEKQYDIALDKLEITFSRINKGIIHGKKEEGAINSLKSVVSDFNKTVFNLELANYRLSSFLKNGVIKYE